MEASDCNESEEFFDVVDEADVVIDRQPRSVVHRQGLRHRAVHIFLFRSDGRMLIHLRTATKEEFPSVWTSSASGHVSAGETYASTAERELFEELGIRATPRLLARFNATADTSNEFTELFQAESDDVIVPDRNEIADVRWAHTAEIASEIRSVPDRFSPAFRLLFTHFLSLSS